MKEYPMPCGIPVWKKNWESVELESFFGFIETYAVCPTNISRPFLAWALRVGLAYRLVGVGLAAYRLVGATLA